MESESYKEAIDRIFSSGKPEWVLRSMSVYIILKDRIYVDILPQIIFIIRQEREFFELNKEQERTILGKLVSCAVYIMQGSIAEHYGEDLQAGKYFFGNILNLFLKDFNEKLETLEEYERDTYMGHGQVVHALGKMCCDVLGIKCIISAFSISQLAFPEINRIELNTTISALTMPIAELKKMVKSVATQYSPEEWL